MTVAAIDAAEAAMIRIGASLSFFPLCTTALSRDEVITLTLQQFVIDIISAGLM